MKILAVALGMAAVILGAGVASAQQPTYGAPITLETARKAVAGAQAQAKKLNVNFVITVLDSGGNVVLVERMDGAQFGSVEISRQKAWAAVAFRRPTKVWEDAVASGGAGVRVLGLPGAIPSEGGLPIMVGGKVVGGIGVSGGTAQQDGQVAKAGLDALAK